MPQPKQRLKTETLILAGLLALNFLSRILVALRPLPCIDGVTIPDDAYLSLKIAKNIAQGLGPFYGAGFTNGFQPLYVFLMAPAYWIWPANLAAPVHAALALLTVFDTLALLFLWRLVKRKSRSLAAPILVATAWVFNPQVIGTTLNGLETMIAFSLIALVFERYFALNDEPGRIVPVRDDLRLGGLIGLAIFARIDSIFLLPALGAALAVREWERMQQQKSDCDYEHEHEARARKGLAGYGLLLIGRWGLLALGALLVNLPWLVYSWHYTGDLFPISGRAVRFMSLANAGHKADAAWYGDMINRGLAAVRTGNQTLLWLIAALAVLAAAVGLKTRRLTRDAAARRLFGILPILLFAALLFTAYTCYIFGPWFFGRYLFPLTLACLALAATLLDLLDSMVDHGHPWLALNLALVACVITGQVKPHDLATLYTAGPNREMGYMNIGLWARDNLKPGSVVGSSQTGGLGYFAENLKVINLDGVVNKDCYRALVDRRYLDYIRRAGVQYVLGWGVNISFIASHSANWQPSALEPLQEIRDFRSWGNTWYLYRVRGGE